MNPHTTWLRQVLVRELTSLIAELELFPSDAMVWAVAPGITNSSGNITLHLCGNLQHFIGATLGNTGYVRHRDLEFSQRDVPRHVLMAEIRATIGVVNAVLAHRPDDAMLVDYPDVLGGGLRLTCGLFLQQLAVHLAHHLGQVGYLRRILAADVRSAGAISMHALGAAPP